MKKYTLVIAAVMMLFSSGYSQIGLKTIRGKVGVIMPEDPWDVGFDIGAAVDMGEITKNLHLVPNIAYWSSGYSLDLGYLGSYDIGLSNFQLGADVNYFFSDGLYAGGGLSMNFFGGDIDSDIKFGFDAMFGYIYKMKSFNIYTEARYNFISDFNTMEIVAGIEFPMGK